jgi:HK97 family phage prohead protease
LHGSFSIRRSTLGDEVISDLREGYLPAMSVGFKPVQVRRGKDGETEVVEGQLKEVSLLPIGAYEGARVLQLRGAEGIHVPTVSVDLSPVVPGWAY